MIKRKGLVIYFAKSKILKEVKKYHINITHVNADLGYAVGYVDEEYFEKTKKQIANLRGIKKVEESLTDMEHLSFEE
ncbi:MAG: DUF2129 domain-containing protein [Candidatus Izemoplasmatales bacterium]|nr:DUF2129 domain-containing protein [Candidatus Izemoplasmatales bacterium]